MRRAGALTRRLRPGWDCHGLPIEQKALAAGAARAEDPLHVRAVCSSYAAEAIRRQQHEMERWGLLADFCRPVVTMDPAYEAAQLRVFAQFLRKGLIFSDKKPVFWSPSSRFVPARRR